MTNLAITSAAISTGSNIIVTSSSSISRLILHHGTSAAAIAFASHYGVSNDINPSSSISSLKSVTTLRGGGIRKSPISQQEVKATTDAANVMTPQAKSVMLMAIGMSIHYLAYSLARPSTLALFTSKTVGFASSPGAFPLAMALVSPASLALLAYYTFCLSTAGPKGALRRTTWLCSLTLILCPVLIETLSRLNDDYSTIIRIVVGAIFIFREAYVQLLTSQYWSFMSSVLTPTQSSKWFAPISGLTSITSAVAGWTMALCVEKVGLNGVLISSGLLLSTSLFFTERAYTLSEEHGFNPADELIKRNESKQQSPAAKNKGKKIESNDNETSKPEEEEGMLSKASNLFGRAPVLKSLFMEILACQGLSTLLNVLFVTKLSQSMPDDSQRAGWMGKFFATINVISCVLQFGILPPLMSVVEPSTLWRLMPLIMVGLTSLQALDVDPSLLVISGSFMAMKTMEFSVRRMLDELVYVPLDFDSRYLGKEIIGVFGYRFGKSGMSLALSGLTSLFGNFGLQKLSYLTTGASFMWLTTSWQLSNKVLTRSEAEEAYKKIKGLK
eukprot:CAMPEP_0197835884 /NCGR_PEP_ID=MMETSP1437-20131217/27262_1 /TAXON_ID=49252 ORGANISM="Eucampia antarctica, Strain CCMP1452" /NCGR_SAMPLE_ID=MMETSP1437 /ASSEMBLY_ACC=CAM_ASM_001096 /LENGTH=556 /DNA_ID=CAMNT_0043441625 /DNA_START=81 /DNA_END=1751 /DNA_ORIENTATION=+